MMVTSKKKSVLVELIRESEAKESLIKHIWANEQVSKVGTQIGGLRHRNALSDQLTIQFKYLLYNLPVEEVIGNSLQ